MENTNATPANNPARLLLDDVQTDAIVLAGMLEAIDLMGNEGPTWDEPRNAVTIAARERAQKLANDLDRVMK